MVDFMSNIGVRRPRSGTRDASKGSEEENMTQKVPRHGTYLSIGTRRRLQDLEMRMLKRVEFVFVEGLALRIESTVAFLPILLPNLCRIFHTFTRVLFGIR